MRGMFGDISCDGNPMTLFVVQGHSRLQAFAFLLRTFLGRTKMLFVDSGKRLATHDLPRVRSVSESMRICGSASWVPWFVGVQGCKLTTDEGNRFVTVHPITVLDAIEAAWRLSKLPAVGFVFDGHIKDEASSETRA